MMRRIAFLLLLVLAAFGCTKDRYFDSAGLQFGDDATMKSSSPKVKIAVISDIHFLDPSLMPENYVTNPDFQQDMSMDRKLIELSDPIFREVISRLTPEKPDILMILGDMACQGELLSHETVAARLQELENTGIRVFVIPGNNDILNPDAVSYKTIPESPAENISSDMFTQLYGNFGYNEAISRDPASLSYVCQPFSGLWIMGIDACKYTDNGDGTFAVDGAIADGTMDWISERMAEARAAGITVLTMMHFAIVEHYVGQAVLEGERNYIENHASRAQALADEGLRLIFTGHLHGNDITDVPVSGRMLTAIETGSLVTPPIPYRLIYLDDNFIKNETGNITGVDAEIPGGMDFMAYADSTIRSHFNTLCYSALRYRFGVPKDLATQMAPFFTSGFMAHFAGDEKMPPAEREAINVLAETAPPSLMPYLLNMWTDLPPYSDNKIHIKLK